MDETLRDLIDESISSDGAHADVAKIVHEMYKDNIKYSNEYGTKTHKWYININNTWTLMHEGFELRNLLSTKVSQKFMERALYWNIESTRSGVDDEERNTYQQRKDILNKVAVKLKQASYKNSIMRECGGLFIKQTI